MTSEIVITVKSQKGECARNHREGQCFRMSGVTPEGICVSAFAAMLPAIRVLMLGGVHPWSPDPDAEVVACPDPDNPVVFEVRRIESGAGT